MMTEITQPQFLNPEELTDYKKDTCLFCNERFRTRSKSSSAEVWASGCYADYKYTVTTTTHYVADLGLYYFSFKFRSGDEVALHQKKLQLKTELTRKIEAQVPVVRQELQKHLSDLPERWKDKKGLLVETLVREYLSELRPGYKWDRELSPLEQRLEKLFHNLEFGDLQLVEKGYDSYDSSSRDSQTVYCPGGLKSHHRCWPYAPLSEPTELALPFGQLVEPVLKNKRFADYEKLFEEIPGIWKEVQQMPITLKAYPYNPVDLMVG